jgi:hypothetical protein
MRGAGVCVDHVSHQLMALHLAADQAVAELAARHGARLQCRRGCHDCCVDDIAVLAIEAGLIRRQHAHLLASGEPHPEGGCAFLDPGGACRIYAHRPLVCRSEGLPLRWQLTEAGGRLVERRDICPLNDREGSLVSLPPEQCWLLGPWEARLAALQSLAGFGPKERVALRALFASSQPAERST